ncbi:MAG: hypothetical protein ACYDA4_01740 [Ignavibacteriaceae bacterium]
MDSIDIKKRKEIKARLTFYGIIIKPLIFGTCGFACFFIVLALEKYFGYILGSLDSFRIDVEDLLLCLLGFILSYLIKFLENFQGIDSKK